MNRDEWLALVDRCENANGADRIASEGILRLLGYGRFSDAHWWCAGKGHFNVANQITSSIDAITALIERELPGVLHGYLPSSQVVGLSDVALYRGVLVGAGHEADGVAATPAVALCAAFCKAMADKAET